MESEFPNTSFKCQQLESKRLQKGFTIVPKGTLILETAIPVGMIVTDHGDRRIRAAWEINEATCLMERDRLFRLNLKDG